MLRAELMHAGLETGATLELYPGRHLIINVLQSCTTIAAEACQLFSEHFPCAGKAKINADPADYDLSPLVCCKTM